MFDQYGLPIKQRTPPVSNTERQRQFRERNPGYYGRLHRKRNAMIDASIAAKEQQATMEAAIRLRYKPQLALPAPVVSFDLFSMNIKSMNESIAGHKETETTSVLVGEWNPA